MNGRYDTITTEARRQAARDCTWKDEEEFEEDDLFGLDRKQLKRDAWHKAAAYAREVRRRYALSYQRAYRREIATRVRHAS